MKKQLRHSFRVDASLERAIQVLCSPQYNVEAEKLRRDPISTEYRLIAEDDDRKVFELHSVEWERTRTGKPNRSKKVSRVTRFTWSAARGQLSWELLDAGRSRIAVTGRYRLTADGDGTRLEREVDIEVKLPLVGGAVASVIQRQLEESWPAQQTLFRKTVAASPDADRTDPGWGD